MTQAQPHPHHVHQAYPQMIAPAGVPGGMVAVPAHLVPSESRFNQFMMRQYARSPRWFAPMAVLVCFFGAASYTLVSNPTDANAFSSPTCIIKMTTGFDCPGCGGTRAFWYLLHGDVPAAARSHILAVFATPFLVWMFLAWAGNQIFGWKLPYLRITPKVISVFLAVWFVFTIMRNLPWAPFTWLYV